MIKNERQYRITQAEAKRFAHALDQLERQNEQTTSIDPVLYKAQCDALHSQLQELTAQLKEYDALKSGERGVIEVNALDELPRALVQARIAAGLSQKELADRLGLKEQQIQRYEATDYSGATLSRLAEVARALGVNVREEIFLPADKRTVMSLLSKLKEVGLDKDFLLSRLVPHAIAQQVETESDNGASNLIFHLITNISRIFGWTTTAILSDASLRFSAETHYEALGTARFKFSSQAERKKLSAYTVYAHYLALLLLKAAKDLPQKPLPQEPDEFYTNVALEYGSVTFESVLRYIWGLGIPVLPLRDPGGFHGACWRVKGRNVIVLKHRGQSFAKWLHDLLHEYRHLVQEPQVRDLALVEEAEISLIHQDSEEERDANDFAVNIALAGNAENLVRTCVAEAKGELRALKRVVPAVAKREGVPVGSLANYLAYRLTADGHNWWGTATNLQGENGNPWQIARDLLILNVNFGYLSDIDRNLLIRALSEYEA